MLKCTRDRSSWFGSSEAISGMVCRVISEMSSVGGVILAGLAISNLLEIKKIRTGSFLPALIVVVVVVLLLNKLGIAWH